MRQSPTGNQERATQAATGYDRIKEAIIRFQLEPGQPVTEEQLAEMFGIGRSAARSSVQRLCQEMLVQKVTERRYVVAPITLKNTRDLFEMRLILEPAGARLAAGRIDQERLQQLTNISQMRYEPGNEESAATFLRANTRFHLAIAEASGNLVLTQTIANVLDRVERVVHLSHMYRDQNEDLMHEHQELIAALMDNDSQRAAQLMYEHCDASQRTVIEAITSSPSVQSVSVYHPVIDPRSTIERPPT